MFTKFPHGIEEKFSERRVCSTQFVLKIFIEDFEQKIDDS